MGEITIVLPVAKRVERSGLTLPTRAPLGADGSGRGADTHR